VDQSAAVDVHLRVDDEERLWSARGGAIGQIAAQAASWTSIRQTQETAMSGETEFRAGAYDLDDPDKTRDFYRQWAETYDAEVKANGYASPARVAAAMAANVADKSAPLLDLGCGTGLSGEAFLAAGFTTVDGADFSAEMLAGAETKRIYRNLAKGDLQDPIPAEPGDYQNIAAVGVFSPGHAPVEMIDQVLGLLPPGGCFGFTLNDHALAEKSYEARVKELSRDGTIEIVFEEYGDHLPKRGVKSKVYVLKKR
jgi:SAM-dependent methyltransferase